MQNMFWCAFPISGPFYRKFIFLLGGAVSYGAQEGNGLGGKIQSFSKILLKIGNAQLNTRLGLKCQTPDKVKPLPLPV